MIDSLCISEGMCAWGNVRACAGVHSPVNVIRFAADPDVQCARLAGDSHLGEERKLERKRDRENRKKEKRTLERRTSKPVTCSTLQPMHTEGLKAEIVIEERAEE